MLHVGYVDTGFAQKEKWFGMKTPTGGSGSGVTPENVGDAMMRLLASRRMNGLVGWKERAIALGDRVVPELYDRLLKLRGGSS
jgi:hypothetical protein